MNARVLTRRPSSTRASATAFFFFKDTATTEIYTLSLHDALPISPSISRGPNDTPYLGGVVTTSVADRDRKSTRLNSSHITISYAVFCLHKKRGLGYEQDYSLAKLYLQAQPITTLL